MKKPLIAALAAIAVTTFALLAHADGCTMHHQ